MKKLLLLSLLSCVFLQAQNEIDLSYYLPQGVTYNQNIPTPESIIGHQVGKWHVTHDKLVQYMYALANASDRITIENRGKTFEDRPLLLLTITSPENHQRIDDIRKTHIAATESNSVNTTNMPIVVYQGFSIHGNEPSGANAGLLAAYYLAAAEGEAINDLLDNVIILFDPSLNPDGLQRFAYWANTNKSINLNPDPNDREYSEVWPGGRTNHYWFDMNRDWLPVQLPESRARIATFHKWLPNILTDHHEMGTNTTFFFQPGIQSRTHPLTPKLNQELTKRIANYHAKALDKIGSLYYTEESFDDFYYGKGSTFPDINGGIGILFEQASSRGHVQESDNGLLTFPFGIRNQFTAALSTLEAAKNMKCKIIAFSSGGEMKEFCSNNNIEHRIVLEYHSPRSSLPSFLYTIFKVLHSSLKIEKSDILDSIKELEVMGEKINSSNLTKNNPALKLANWITGIPIIYHPFGLQSVAIRFKNSLQENAKTHVMAEDIIEACHNGIVSWEKSSYVHPILLEGVDDHTKTKE
ncbi:MAG: hypothetical protein IIC74_04100, partial [Bacteroidetes bacterium]|nr:hypothetical protein [Bacteroidota bacterium]